MKLKLSEVRNKLVALSTLHDKTFPAEMEYSLIVNIDELEEKARKIEQVAEKLREKYAKKDENGLIIYEKFKQNGIEMKRPIFTKENDEAFVEEYEHLLEEEVEIDVRMIDFELVEKCNSVDRYDVPNVRELKAMRFMITKRGDPDVSGK